MMKIAVLVLSLMLVSVSSESAVKKEAFGKMPDGTPIEIYTLSDGKVEARIMTYGAIVVGLKAPDRTGKQADIVLGFDSLDDYVNKNNPHFGGIVGRYANRIAHGTFTLDGKQYSIPTNDGDNALHGGPIGFDKAVWKGKALPNGVELTHVSKDGDQGFPGTLTAVVRYTLSNNALRIEYSATTDKNTVVNLTNHSYFNLAGQGEGDILSHQVKIDASRFTPVDEKLIPTGELAPVEGTPFDFRKSTKVGERIEADDEQIRRGKGYDHNWVLDAGGKKLAEAAEVYEPSTGRVLTVLTTEPGVQFYTGNFLDGIAGKGGKTYPRRSGLCLETQHFPDSPNHPKFPSTELKAGQRYHTVTVYRFSAR